MPQRVSVCNLNHAWYSDKMLGFVPQLNLPDYNLHTRRINGGFIMWEDSIVKDVRKAGEELAKQSNTKSHSKEY